MTTILDLFQQAQLAEAAYVNFFKLGFLLTSDDDVNAALQTKDFSSIQATDFVSKWTVIDQYTAINDGFFEMGTGFSATLFQNKTTEQYVFSIRGTEFGIPDLAADLGDIVTDGVAMDQVIEMYNYWHRLQASEGEPYWAAKLELLITETFERAVAYGISNIIGKEFDALMASKGYLIDLPTGQVKQVLTGHSDDILGINNPLSRGIFPQGIQATDLLVTGHSLGGHLAVAFTRLFADTGATALTINGAGYPTGNLPGLGLNAISNIQNLFARLNGNTTFSTAAIYNVYGSAAIDFVTMNDEWGLVQQGAVQEIFTESYSIGNTVGHGSSQMTDSLAVYDIFMRLDPSLQMLAPSSVLNTLAPLFKASAVDSHVIGVPNIALETLVGKLSKLLLNVEPILKPDDREDLYREISNIRNVLEGGSGMVQRALHILANVDMATILFQADRNDAEGVAFRYALKELNSFVVTGVNYTPHNVNGELNLYDAATGAGLTTNWLEDRAAMLSWLNIRNIQDITSDIGIIPYGDTPQFFQDAQSGITLQVGTITVEARKFSFGTDLRNDAFIGSNQSDRLYGMGGNDSLIGKGGNDYLEGGQGHDVLAGGTGANILNGGLGEDSYYVLTGPGNTNQIVDFREADGKFHGRIYVNGQLTTTPLAVGGLFLRNGSDTSWTYKGSAATASTIGHHSPWTITLDDGSVIDLGDYQDGDYGIHLLDESQSSSGYGTVLTGTDYADHLIGDAGNTHLLGLEGNDALDDLNGGDDLLDGGGGRDTLDSGQGNDILIGGNDSESDILVGVEGEDILYARTQTSLAVAYAQLAAQIGNGQQGDYLDGGDNDDTLIGDSGNDVLMGGGGDDILLGGGGGDLMRGDVTANSVSTDWTASQQIITTNGSTEYRGIFTGMDLEDAPDPGDDVLYGQGGNDWIHGDSGNDYLDGGDDNDALFGDAGADVLYGGDGNDALVGDDPIVPEQQGNDWLDGGAGEDLLHGNGGDDRLYGSAGNDTLQGGMGDDILDGGTDDDTLFGGAGTDELYGSDGNDMLLGDTDGSPTADQGADILEGGEGDDRLYGYGGADIISGGNGNDRVVGGAEDDNIAGGAGADILWGDDGHGDSILSGNDTIDGGEGADQLVGEDGNDILLGGAGDDALWGDVGNDTLEGGVGLDYLEGGAGNDTYRFSAGDGLLQGIYIEYVNDAEGSNTVQFGAGIVASQLWLWSAAVLGDYMLQYGTTDYVYLDGSTFTGIAKYSFSDGTELTRQQFMSQAQPDPIVVTTATAGAEMIGGRAEDTLTATGGGSSFWGGHGNDVLFGAGGSNTYHFSLGDGTDRITETSAETDVSGNPTFNRIVFDAGIEASDLRLGLGSLRIQVGANPEDAIHIEGFDPNNALALHPIDVFEFSDGTVLSYAQLLSRGFDIDGTAGNDTLSGTNLDDRLDGKQGSDFISGKGGADTYRFSRGSGSDTIADADALFGAGDTLSISGEDVTTSSVGLQRSGNDLLLSISGSPDSVRLKDYLVGGANGVEFIRFEQEGVTWNVDMVKQLLLRGSASADTLVGYSSDDVLDGMGGNDMLYGGAGNDTLIGGVGNDFLQGDSGNDRYVISAGDGLDRIADSGGGMDTVAFSVGIEQEQMAARRSGNDLILAHANGIDQITLVGYFLGASSLNAIERIEFSNGLVWTEQDIRVALLRGTDAGETLTGFETADLIDGKGGDDFLYGGGGDDVLIGGTGNDTLQGDSGNDRYVFSIGEGVDRIIDSGGGIDTVVFSSGIEQEQLVARRSGNDLIITHASATDRLTLVDYFLGPSSLNAIERIEFSNGTAWSEQDIQAALLRGTDARETLTGFDSADFIDGKGGDDWLYGGAGDDVLIGGEGADTLYGQVGNDVLDGRGNNGVLQDQLYGGPGSDVYRLGMGSGKAFIREENLTADWDGIDTVRFDADITAEMVTMTRGLQELQLKIRNDPGSLIRFPDYFVADGRGPQAVEKILYAAEGRYLNFSDVYHQLFRAGDGNDLLYGLNGRSDTLSGGAGNDELQGLEGHDTLVGGAGNDRLYGAAGSDTYHYSLGDGQDVILDFDPTTEAVDRLLFGPGIAKTDVVLTQSGTDLLITFAGWEGSILDSGHFIGTSHGIEQFGFSDGSFWQQEDIASRFATSGSEFGDSLSGTEVADHIYGLAGVDQLYGLAGNDMLDGGAGWDNLYGGEGADRLYGGTGTPQGGTNYLYGGDGDDYLVAGADGASNYLYGEAGNDILDAAGGTGTNLLEDRSGNNLFSGSTLRDHIYGGGGSDLYIGRAGSDWITTGDSRNSTDGRDFFLYNKGDGDDSVTTPTTGDAGMDGVLSIGRAYLGEIKLTYSQGLVTLSVGRYSPGIRYNPNNLTRNPVRYLQVVIEGTRSYNPASSDPLYNKKIVVFDFAQLAEEFFEAKVNKQRWNMVQGLRRNLEWSSDTEALGGALAYQYARQGNIDNISNADRLKIINDSSFALSGQAISVSLPAVSPLLMGTAGSDELNGSFGSEVLQGLGGADLLEGAIGNDVLDGGSDDDRLIGGSENDFLAGGTGNDSLSAGTGMDLIAFNKGDGQDTVVSAPSSGDTISLGGGIQYRELALSRRGQDLILEVGDSDRLELLDWYSSSTSQGVLKLQVIAQAMADFNANGPDTLRDDQVEVFDFSAITDRFDAAQAADPTFSRWAVMDALLDTHLSGSDTEALGGDLAYHYGMNGSLGGMGIDGVRHVTTNAVFASQPQAFRTLTELQEGLVKLAI